MEGKYNSSVLPEPDKGLSSAQVSRRVEKGYVNKADNKTSKSAVQIIRDNLFTFFNLINAVLAVLIIGVGSYKNLLFLGIVISNTLIGIIQELRAKRTIDKLSLITATKAQVIRNGRIERIDITELVLDDVMILSSGNQICTDSFVRDGILEVNEAMITGESDVVIKRCGDVLYSGSFVVSGRARVQVMHVGGDNFANQIIAEAKIMKKHKSKLKQALNSILKVISIIIIPIGSLLFLSQYYISGAVLGDAVVNTVAAVLGMIPEGLVLLTSIALAVGVINLGRHNTLVHELFCIETLARADVLCLDKTGTLTEGKMKVEKVIELEAGKAAGLTISAEDEVGSVIHYLKEDNATSMALQEYFDEKEYAALHHTIPFSSERKYSGVCLEGRGTILLGAFEFLFPEGGYEEVRELADHYTVQGIRVLTLAVSREMAAESSLPPGLVPCAVILISDVIRENAEKTLRFFMEQDVQLYVISGDNPVTAAYIAGKAGFPESSSYIDASAIKDEEELKRAAEQYRIFGRVTPRQKKEIVRALQDQGHIVAMTGDGVNDVLALKEADCSIAMAAGSDAAKDCANLVLLDSDFDSMPFIVKEGRRVINNIQSSASLFLVKTIYSVALSILTLIISSAYPFIPIQLTIINMFAVGIPTFILSMELNFTRVKDGFLRNVLHNALTGAITIILEISVITAISGSLHLSEDFRSTVCVMATGITGLCMIKKVFPLHTVLRKAVYYTMFVLFLGSTIVLQEFLNFVTIDYRILILTAGFVIGNPYVIEIIYRLLDRLNRIRKQAIEKLTNNHKKHKRMA